MKFVNYHHPKYGDIKIPIDPPLRENFGARFGMKAGDYIAGVNSPLDYKIVLPKADWRGFTVLGEPQFFNIGDSFGCTDFANNNAAEIQLKQSTGEEYNFSDAASAVLSGTQPGVGNYMASAPERSRKYGRILQTDWPNGSSVPEFYRPVPQEVQNKAVKFNEAYEFIDTSIVSLQHHLKHVPPTIMLKAGNSNHDVVALFADSNGIWYFDSYPHDTQNNYIAITTQIPLAILKIIVEPMNTVYFVHKKGTGEYGLLVDSPVGKQYVPASTEDDLKARGGIAVPLKADGKVDYSQAREIDVP